MNTRKHEILGKALSYDSHRVFAVELASKFESREQVDTFRQEVFTKHLFWNRLEHWYKRVSAALIVGFVLIYGFLLSDITQVLPRVSNFILFFIGLLAVLTTGFMWLVNKSSDGYPYLNELMPLTDTREAVEALQWVERGDPLVVEWKNLALKERGVLYHFDLTIIVALAKLAEHERQRATQEAHREERLNEIRQASAKLHTVS